jgi:hypothetical protein
MKLRLPALSYRPQFSTLSWPLLLLVLSLSLFIRLHSLDYIPESLWNEDGTVFINQSHEFGIKSLWIPFQGSLFLFHRLVALLATRAPLIAVPYIFFGAWVLSFFLIVWVVKHRGTLLRIDSFSLFFLLLAIALQPSQGEAWFNMNHVNFFFGVLLAIYVCTPVQRSSSVAEILLLVLVSLSTQCTTIIAAILFLQLIVLRDFSVRRATYIVVLGAAVIQVFFGATAHRLEQTGIGGSPIDWLNAALALLFFGKTDTFVCAASASFWVVTFVYLVKWILSKGTGVDRILWLSPLFAAVTAVIVFAVETFAVGRYLSILPPSPLDMESRYFLVPYSLLFFAAFVCTKDAKNAQTVLFFLVGLICGSGFLTVDRSDRASTTGLLAHTNMQWSAFAKLQRIEPDIVIPINSPWPTYPPIWNVQVRKVRLAATAGDHVKPNPILLSPRQSNADGDPPNMERSELIRNFPPEMPTLRFYIGNYCVKTRYLALEIDIWRSKMGAARIYWGQWDHTDTNKSLDRFYPAGAVTMQFAFRRDISDSTIELQPALGVPQSAIVRTLRYLKSKNGSSLGITVAEPTSPGGKVALKEVRLLCLE